MWQDGAKAGLTEITACQEAFRFNMVVHFQDGSRHARDLYNTGSVQTLHLSYHKISNHYNSIRRCDDPGKRGISKFPIDILNLADNF